MSHQRLLHLLDLPHVDEAAPPTPTDFETWKLISDRYAKDQDPRASEVAMLAVQVAQTTNNATCLGLAHWMAGNVYFWRDLPEVALEHFETAEAAFRQRDETLQIARMAGSKASALIDLGKFEAALTSITQWLAVLAASPDELDQQRLASLHNLRGVASDLSGRLTEALEGYQRKLEWWQPRVGDEAEIQVARSRINIGVVQTRLGQYAEAEAAFTQAQTALHPHTHSAAVLRDLARVDMNLAWLAMTRGRATSVVRAAFVQARTSAQQQAVPLSPDLALLTLFEAEWLLHIGEGAAVDVNALLVLRDHCTQAGLVYEVARAELALGECASRRGESDIARHHFGQVLAAPIAREDADFPYLAHLGLARVCQSLGQLDAAITHFQSALQAVEGVRQRIRQDDFRAGYFEDKLAAYRGLTRALLHTQYFEEAFAAIEQTKGRTLTEALHTETDTPEPLGLSALAAQLPTDTLAIQYALVGDEVMALLVDQAGLVGEPVALGNLPALDELRRGLNRITSVGQLPPATADAFAAQHIRAAQVVLQRWHTQFLAPLQPALARYRKLLISPDGLLNLLPFACLFDAASAQYLCESHDLTITPCFGVWAHIQPRLRPLQPPYVAVGCSSAGRLRHAPSEAQQIAALLSEGQSASAVQVLIETDARCDRLHEAAQGARLLYLATHAVFRPDAPAFSYLELADGRLETADIRNLALDAALVVLSACETGVGHLSGNELIGLVRAFIAAGACSVLATHWAVDDEATAHLMRTVGQGLRDELDVATALGQAQRWLCRGVVSGRMIWQHPYFWGGLSTFGSTVAF